MRFFQTLRFKLTLLYLLFIATPFVISAFALPYYIQGILSKETQQLTSGTITALSRVIETYLDDLDRLSTSPYLSDEVMTALKLKASGRYETANEYTRLKTDRALSITLPQTLINTRSDILNTIIVPKRGPAYLASKGNQVQLADNFPFREQSWYQHAVQNDGRALFVSAHIQAYLNNSPTKQVFSVARLIKDPDSGQPLAVIMADADNKILEKITKDITFNVSSTIVILDQNQNVLYASRDLTEELRTALAGSQHSALYESESYTGISRTIDSSNWQVIVYLSNQELMEKVRWIYIIGLLLSVGALIITLCVFIYFSRWIVNPFKKMNVIMSKVQKGDLSVRFQPRGKDEIDQLGLSLNKMVSRLDELINQELRAKLAQKNAEYVALQSQIQPHFLYNTLNGFIGLNREGETKKLETAILSLSSMMRYSLKDDQYTTIDNEFQFLHKYCMLQQLRFEERLNVQIHCDEAAASIIIPKLLIQPLVENAIIHGVEPDDKRNTVTIEAKVLLSEGECAVHITITDDGVGFDMHIQGAYEHVGLSNVHNRLLMNNPNASMLIESHMGSGTKICLIIPLGVNEK